MNGGYQNALKAPLHEWVRDQIVSPLTYASHDILRNASQVLLSSSAAPKSPELEKQIGLARQDKSRALSDISQLRAITSEESQIDIAFLLKTPHELFLAENEWAGLSYKSHRTHDMASRVISSNDGDRPVPSMIGAANTTQLIYDTREIVQHALDVSSVTLGDLNRRMSLGELFTPGTPESTESEDSDMKKARLNLIAIAKRAPIDKIARLPADLVPAHIRHIVPTLSS